MDRRLKKTNREWIKRGKGRKQQRAKLAERDGVRMERARRHARGGPGVAALSWCFSFIQQWLCLALMSVAALGYGNTDSVCWCCKGEEVVEGKRSGVFGWHNRITPTPQSPFFPSGLLPPLSSIALSPLPSLPLLISMIECPPPSFTCCLPGSASMQSISKPSVTTALLPTLYIFLPAKQAGGWSYSLHPRSLEVVASSNPPRGSFHYFPKRRNSLFMHSISTACSLPLFFQRLSSWNRVQHWLSTGVKGQSMRLYRWACMEAMESI